MTTLNSILSDIETGLLDIDFNAEAKLQAVIIGDGLDYVGKIIDEKGNIVCDTEFGFESMMPPSAKELIEAYLYAHKKDIYVLEAVVVLAKQRNNNE